VQLLAQLWQCPHERDGLPTNVPIILPAVLSIILAAVLSIIRPTNADPNSCLRSLLYKSDRFMSGECAGPISGRSYEPGVPDQWVLLYHERDLLLPDRDQLPDERTLLPGKRNLLYYEWNLLLHA
jgi:hypothetical protein